MRKGDEPILEVDDLVKHYPVTAGPLKSTVGTVRAVDGISFDVYPGETFGIVGESGCGKSSAVKAMLRLDEPTDGIVRFRGESIMDLTGSELRRFRRNIQMIFQDPDSSFNPRMSVGEAVAEPLRVQGLSDRSTREAIVADLLERVGLAADDAHRYPHEFSGGQKQRIALARALTVNPDVLVADEPVSALDVSIKAELLALLDRLRRELGLTVIIITHDLGVVRELCDRFAVMYLGEIVEIGPADRIFSDPHHPYTESLLSAIPTPDPHERGIDITLRGEVPDPANPPPGCRFHTRCPAVIKPEELVVERPVWRRLLHFRLAVRDGAFDRDRFVESVTGTDSAASDVSVEAIERPLRAEYDLPNRLADAKADAAVQSAIEHIAAGNTAAAIDSLDAVFTTPCEVDAPPMTEHAPDHRSACHLHEPAAGQSALPELQKRSRNQSDGQ